MNIETLASELIKEKKIVVSSAEGKALINWLEESNVIYDYSFDMVTTEYTFTFLHFYGQEPEVVIEDQLIEEAVKEVIEEPTKEAVFTVENVIETWNYNEVKGCYWIDTTRYGRITYLTKHDAFMVFEGTENECEVNIKEAALLLGM